METSHADVYKKHSYSWEGDDLLLAKILSDYLSIKVGFYVDVGAHHPFSMSNTSLLYEKGWSGINIDAMPGAMEPFNVYRSRDVNISFGVGNSTGVLEFSIFDNPALNGFLSQQMRHQHIQRGYAFIRQVAVPVRPLRDILNEFAGHRPIDFMNIDVESLDLQVIQSNDWDSYRPKLLCVETLGSSDVRSVLTHPITQELESLNYSLFSRLHFSSIFIEKTLLR